LIDRSEPGGMGTADDTAEEHGHHLPAVEDWPRGFGEASYWPFVTAIGAAGIYVAAALFLLSRGDSPVVPPVAGPAAVVGSVFLFLAGLYGWLYHAFVTGFWSRDADEKSSGTLSFAMLLFLATDVSTFAAGFVYYFFIRVSAVWPATALPHVLSTLVLVNTAILVASSVTFHFAHTGLHSGNRRQFLGLLGLTFAFGLVFVAGQIYEYYLFIVEEGFTLAEGVYGSAFFGLTGLHGLHVVLGVVLIGIIFTRALLGQYSDARDTSVTTVAMYWHFVDAVWILLVVSLYVGATVEF
jgi:cytochrome c oxidase subunit 3